MSRRERPAKHVGRLIGLWLLRLAWWLIRRRLHQRRRRRVETKRYDYEVKK